jgi:hypothetical protein
VRSKKGDAMDGPRNSYVEKMGQYSMEDVSLIVMYGDVGLEGPKRFTLDFF